VPIDEADDLVQEAFLRLERYEREHEVQSREAFVMRAATNLGVDRARRVAANTVGPLGELNLAEIAAGTPPAVLSTENSEKCKFSDQCIRRGDSGKERTEQAPKVSA
jgi:RNA polymerase sigma-70 factor (ECF subfamily)